MKLLKNILAVMTFLTAPVVLAQSVSPHFKAEGKSFTLNTGCSPHAPSVVVAISAATISTQYVHPEDGRLGRYDLQTNGSGFITVTLSNRFSGASETSTLAPIDANYASALSKVKSNVEQVLHGSACVKGVADLQDVEDYLQQFGN